MTNHEITLHVRSAIADFEQHVGKGKMTGVELAQHILSITLALRNAVEDLDVRVSINEMRMTTLPLNP